MATMRDALLRVRLSCRGAPLFFLGKGSIMGQQPHTESETAPPESSEQQGSQEEYVIEPTTAKVSETPKKLRNRKQIVVAISVMAIVLIAIGIFVLTYCPHDEWSDATCTEPKTCVKCGKTEGEALGHDWKDATCTEPKTCQRCGETEGEALGHKPGEWSSSVNALSAKRSSEQKCTVCGAVVDSKDENLTTFVDNGKFILSPSGFNDRLNFELLCIKNCKLSSSLTSGSGSTLELDVHASSGSGRATGYFLTKATSSTTEDDMLTSESKEKEGSFASVVFVFSDAGRGAPVAQVLFAVVQAADPSMSSDSSEARSFCSQLTDGLNGNVVSGTKNGINYSIGISGNEWCIGVKVA